MILQFTVEEVENNPIETMDFMRFVMKTVCKKGIFTDGSNIDFFCDNGIVIAEA